MLPTEVIRLLEEAAEWRLLGLLFEYPSEAWRDNLCALLCSLPRAELRAWAEAALAQCSPGLHIALFGPAGTVPVREAAYQGGVQLGYLLSELSAYYEAFRFTPETEEAPDHLSVQLGFISFLKMKRALAILDEDPDRGAVVADAEAAFLKEHLAVQAEPVLLRLENFGPDYLVDAGRRIREYAGPPPQSGYPFGSALPDGGEDSEAMCCGPAASDPDGLVPLLP